MGKVDYTVLSKDMGEPVSRGRSAEIYPFGEDRVVKLYFPDFPESDVDLEFHNTVEAFKQGCTPMECFGKVRSGDRFGIILKRLNGISLTKMPEKNPLILFKAGKLIASEHARVQKCDGSALTDLRDKAAKCLDGEMFAFLSDADRKKIADYIPALPAGNAFIHLDFHTENILMTADGPVVIDWMTAAKGVPAAEVAMMEFLHSHAELFPGSSKAQLAFYTAVRSFIYKSFLKNYVKITGFDTRDIAPWRIVALVLRLGLWNIASEKEYLEGEIKRLADCIK